MNDIRSSTDPFSTLINLMGAALAGPARPDARATAPGGTLPPEEPMPLRPEPADRKAGPPPGNEGGWFERLDQWLWRERQRELESRLADAVDLPDLEQRLRERERSLLQRYY